MINQGFFKIHEAEKLLLHYVKKREKSKALFLASLINCYYLFYVYNETIIGQNIELFDFFRIKTAETVLQELGYKIVSFSSKKKYFFDETQHAKRVSVICFIEA